jgi:type II secretory pathway component PulK
MNHCGLRIEDCGLKTATASRRFAVVAVNPQSAIRTPQFRSARGTVLIIAMWVLVVLSGLALMLACSMRAEGDRASNDVAVAQAQAVQEGAIQYVLANVKGLGGKIPSESDVLCEAVSLNDGVFWILRPTDDDTTYAFGITDEASRLNLNTATQEMLQKLPKMTNEFAASVIDWRDADSSVTSGGAESEYYLLLPNAYECKNGALETVEELMLIKGATTDIVYGQDKNRNGLLDPGEEATMTTGMTLTGSLLDRGIVNLVTVYSTEQSVSATSSGSTSGSTSGGTSKVNVNTASPMSLANALQQIVPSSRMPGVLDRIRRERPFRNLFDFYFRAELTPDEFQKAYPKLTTASGSTGSRGLININTAPAAVLKCLPQLEDGDVKALIAQRPTDTTSDPSNLWWVVNALPRAKALAIGSYITGVTYQFSADIVSVAANGRAYRRCRVVIDARTSPPKVIYRQDLTRLGWPLDPEILTQLRSGAGLDGVLQVTGQGNSSL